jgi:lysophospholipase L1-like esterase
VQRDELYLALGDATGAGAAGRDGYPERILGRLREVRQSARLLNLCQAGATSLDVLQAQLPEAERLQPALITLGVGLHDATSGADDEAFRRNLEELAQALKRLRAPIVLCNVPDLALAPIVRRLPSATQLERRVEVLNRHVEATLFAGSRAVMAEGSGWPAAEGFHPGDAGSEAFAVAAWPAVRELVTRREPRPALS